MTIAIRYMSFVREKEREDPKDVRKRPERRLEHAAFGLASEAGEVAALARRALTSGDPVPPKHVLDECGDILYYAVMALDSAGWTIDDAMEWNMIKLGRRAEHGKDKAAEAVLLEDFR